MANPLGRVKLPVSDSSSWRNPLRLLFCNTLRQRDTYGTNTFTSDCNRITK